MLDKELPSVLVIDDDAGHRLHLVSILRNNGFPCASASSALEALEVAARLEPDLVLARRPESAPETACLLADVKRLLPAARVCLFVSLVDVATAN